MNAIFQPFSENENTPIASKSIKKGLSNTNSSFSSANQENSGVKKRKALGSLSNSEMNSRIQSSNIGKDTSFGEKSVTKPSSKSKTASHPHIAVEISNKDDEMLCTGMSKKVDPYDRVHYHASKMKIGLRTDMNFKISDTTNMQSNQSDNSFNLFADDIALDAPASCATTTISGPISIDEDLSYFLDD